MKRISETGNALWFILLAVVLIGLLTMVISRSGSSVDQSGDIEQMRLKAGQMMRFGKSVEAAIQQLILNGCSEKEISFENAVSNVDYENNYSPADNSCHIFAKEGAGLNWPHFSDTLLPINDELMFHSGILVFGMGTDVDNSGTDLTMLVAVDAALCARINKDIGADVSSAADIAGDLDDWFQEYKGWFEQSPYYVGDVGNAIAPALYNHNAGCFTNVDGDEVFYYVILAR